MRKDFAKILVERERHGGNHDRKGRNVRDHADLPKKQGMKKAHKDRKSLNENLAPLKRFLTGAVGRPWDKVYSEICENIRLDNTVQRHILEHIYQYVERHVEIVGKKVFRKAAHYGHKHELWDKALYVDPVTGILRKYKRKEVIKQHNPFRDAFHQDLNYMISGSKGQTYLYDNTFWKVYKNPTTGEWDLFNKANETHARIDFQHALWNNKSSIGHFFRRHWKKIASHGSPYIKTLIELYVEWVERENKDAERRAAIRKQKDAEKAQEQRAREQREATLKRVFA